MSLDKSKIHNILIVSLTNIGDVILTLPVADVLLRDFPKAKVSIVIGPKARTLLENNSNFEHVYVFNKQRSFSKKIAWFLNLRKKRFDLIVDLRNTALPFFLFSRYRTSFFVDKPKVTLHMRQKHLNRLKNIYPEMIESTASHSLVIPNSVQQEIRQRIEKYIGSPFAYAVVAPGAADKRKKWSEEGFAKVCDRLVSDHKTKIVFIGDEHDRNTAQRIAKLMHEPSYNFCGQTTLIQTAELIRQSQMAIVNDSAPMHLASYLNVPVVALYGPSDPKKYGPWSKRSVFIKKENINDIQVEEVLAAIKENEKV